MPKSTATQRTDCHHCGTSCETTAVRSDGLDFCCAGCLAVYRLLQEYELEGYYDFEQHPGSRSNPSDADRFAFLDAPEVQQHLLDFEDDHQQKVRLFLPAIHCSSCIWLLENLHRLHAGIGPVQVNFVRKEAAITYDPRQLSLRELARLLDRIGYPPQVDLARNEAQPVRNGAARKLIRQLGVAGFCFGNIMLFSLPEYLSPNDPFLSPYAGFFRYLNLALALPVLLFASWDYLTAAYRGLRNRHLGMDLPIALGILVMFSRSAWDILTWSGPGFMDAFAGLVFFLLIGKWFQGKTYNALSFERDYRSYFPLTVSRMEGERETMTPLKHLQAGHRIRVRHGELIPADALILEGSGKIDYSFVTGEAVPVPKRAGEKVFAGGRQAGGRLELEVIRPVSQSYLTRLWQQEAFQKQRTATGIIDRIIPWFTTGVLLLAALTALGWSFIDPGQIAHVVTSVLIVACPCALALTLPFAHGHILRFLGEQGLYLKHAAIVERLSNITLIVWDKTGTLTFGSQPDLSYHGSTLSLAELQGIGALANHSAHPLSQILANALQPAASLSVSRFREVPGKGLKGTVLGDRITLGAGSFVEGSDPAVAADGSIVHVAINGHYRGFFRIRQRYRPRLPHLLQRLQHRYGLFLLSGDLPRDQQQLGQWMGGRDRLFFRQSPFDKLAQIEQWQQEGRQVLMIGDGLNDAGALQQSDAGITVADDVYTFSPACDAILKASRLPLLDRMLTLARYSRQVIRISLVLSLCYNLIGLGVAVTGQLSPLIAAVLMPLSSITVVVVITVLVHRKALQLFGRHRERTV